MYILRHYLIIWFLLCCSLLVGQSDHTFLTYNILNYQDDDDREDDFITVIEYVEPDIIIAQEVIGTSGYNHFQADVVEIIAPGEWSGATFINQSASIDIALFYRHDVFSFISTDLVNTAQSAGTRDVVEWIMEHNESSTQFNVYGVHFKASSGNANAQWRLAEATALRDYLDDLPAGSHFIVAGDFNIYSNSSASEPAFEMLTGEGDDDDGRLFDPVDRIGHWHNNSSFADVHTQSPRSGSYGGMDDRFDWIFASESVLNGTYELNYVADSYWAVGNDGNHFNQAINDGNNTSVNDAMADALHDASDHLPVMVSFTFPSGDPSPYNIVITEVMVNPAAVSDSYGEWFELYNADTVTISMLDWLLLDSGSDEHNVNSISIAPGEYIVFGRNNDSSVNGGYNANYEYSGFQLANSEDEIMLIDDEGRVVDEIAYDSSFPYLSGASMYLKNTAYDNAVDTSWAMSEIPYGDGDYGTPGRAWDDTTSAGIDDIIGLPKEYVLYPAYPNPFNPTTTIRFSVAATHASLLQVYDITGRVVETLVNKRLISGVHEIIWNASNQSSGVYFVRLSNNTFRQTQKLILLK